jgi:uncharacterized protein YccT (UPF0319 family)
MKKIFTILALIFMHNSYALELQGANGVEILAIDGKKLSSSLFKRDEVPNITPGEHQIVVRFSNTYYNDQLVQSRPAIFNIDLQQDTKISVSGMTTDAKAERAIRKGIVWEVISEDNQYSIKDSDILRDNGFMPYRDIEAVIEKYNQKNNISKPVAVASVAEVDTKISATTAEASVPLITLYQQASREEKKAFRLWLLEQDMK